MARVKEPTQSLEALERQRAAVGKMRTDAEERIRSAKEEVDLAGPKDAVLFRQSLGGKDVTKERARLREQTAEKKAALNTAVEEIALMVEELDRLDEEIAATKHQADLDRVAASAEQRRVGLLALGQEIPAALAGVVGQLEALMLAWEGERQIRNRLTGSFDCPGEKVLERLRYLVSDLLAGAQAIGRGTP